MLVAYDKSVIFKTLSYFAFLEGYTIIIYKFDINME